MIDNNKMQHEKLVDVIIPFHNEEKYLERCILSLKKQKYIRKIIGINDFSTDNSKEICLKYNVQVFDMEVPIQKRKSEMADNLNLGLSNSNAMYLLKLDADVEIVSEDYTATLVEFLENEKNKKFFSASGVVYVLEPHWLKALDLFFQRIPRGPARLYRTDALKKIGGFTYNKKLKVEGTSGEMVHKQTDYATDLLAFKHNYKVKFIRKVKAIHYRPSRMHLSYNLYKDSIYRNLAKLFCSLIAFNLKMVFEGLKYITKFCRYKIYKLFRL